MVESVSVPIPATDRWTAWDSFLEVTPETGFMQSSWWADFRTTVGFAHFGVTLKNQHVMVGGAMVQKFSYTSGSCFYYIQDGPVLPQDESTAGQVFEAILENIEDRRKSEQQAVSHLRIEPRWQHLPSFVQGFQTPTCIGHDRFVEPRDTLCIDLRPSETAILAQMKPKGRYNIRVAQRYGVSVIEDTSAQGIADFLGIYRKTTARHEIEAKPAGYIQTLASMLSSIRHGSLFFAEYQGARIAAALVVYFGQRATYFFGGSLVSLRRVMSPYLLHFEIMRRAKAVGYEWYDFWGVAPADCADHPWHDISAFKRKFGGQEFNLVPTLDFIYDPKAYDDYAAHRS